MGIKSWRKVRESQVAYINRPEIVFPVNVFEELQYEREKEKEMAVPWEDPPEKPEPTRFPPLVRNSTLNLVMHFKMSHEVDGGATALHVSLEDSTISSGPLYWDSAESKGYFQDQVIVTMTLEEHPELYRVDDGPQGQNGSAHTSSTVSTTTSVNAGVFGDVATGGGSVSQSDSNTFSRDLSDFAIANRSDSHIISHTYSMTAASGSPYKHPVDLIKVERTLGIIDGFTVSDPPTLAVTNLPIISQATWASEVPITETVIFDLHVQQHLTHVTGYNHFAAVHEVAEGKLVNFTHREKIPFPEVAGPAGRPL